ncbi:uncharacterized protein FFB20_11684 [Fusarium fujikuroi]|nr:uncharacterized protein FFB20_11684 [Fusarium fujikuroi]SCO03172.1 uncharacterized protein FFC1_09229 [Fusarium fujikuroi]SCO35491.1 uncharacterized protein FFNC_04507 [Fusarium fujikuroi]SCV36998.1 uncharacterized protein FFFS_05461 [Fusarium fujikuroi]
MAKYQYFSRPSQDQFNRHVSGLIARVSDNPDYSTNDTGVSDLSPTTGLVADGPQPTKTQAPVSDDIDASPVEATSGFRYDSSSESARPTVETTTSQPVPDATTDAEQPQPDEMRDNSGKLFHCGGVSRQAVNVPQSTDNFSPPFAPLPLRMNVSQALGELSFRRLLKELKPTPPPHHLTLCYPSQTPSTLITITRTSSSVITTGATTIDAAFISQNFRNQPLVNREISQYPTTIDAKQPPGAPDLINNQYRTSNDQPSSIMSDTPVIHLAVLAHSTTIGDGTVCVYPACARMNAWLRPEFVFAK